MTNERNQWKSSSLPGASSMSQPEEFLYFCTVCSLKSSSSLVFLTPPGRTSMVPKNFPTSGDAQFAVVAITLPSPAGDWGDIVLRRAQGGSLCTRMSISPLGVSRPHRIPGPKAAQSLLPFAGLTKEKQSRQMYPKTACGFMVGSGSWAGDGEGRGVGEGLYNKSGQDLQRQAVGPNLPIPALHIQGKANN